MCLIVERGTEEKIAVNDIECWKLVLVDGRAIKSSIHGFRYKLGVRHCATIKALPFQETDEYADFYSYRTHHEDIPKTTYKTGFHAYTTCNRILTPHHGHDNYKAALCIIPAGTKYVEDKTGLICSEAIIIKEIIE